MKLTTDLLTKGVDEALLCPACGEPYCNTVITECGHSFCQDCVRATPLCIVCVEPIRYGELRKNYSIRHLVDKLERKCKNHSNGCEWVGSAKLAPWHEDICSNKIKEETVVSDDETHVDKSLIAPREDINDKLHVGRTPSNKPEVTCGRGCDRLDVMIFIPIKQILDTSFDLEETIGARSTCLIYDHDKGDTLMRMNFDAGPGKVIGDEQDLQIQNEHYDRLWQIFYAGHWKVVNGFRLPCDPEQHPFIHRRDAIGWDVDFPLMQTFMYKYFPTTTNGVAIDLASTPPTSSSSDVDRVRRHFVAFFLRHAQIDKGGSEIKIRTDSTHALLPRDKALRTVKAFMERMTPKEAVGIRGIDSFPESDCVLLHEFFSMYLPYLKYDPEICEFKILPQYKCRFIERDQALIDACKAIDRIGGPFEKLMHVPSTGKKVDDSGGVYQTPRLSHTAAIMRFIAHSDMMAELLRDYPRLKEEKIGFMDAGSGMCYPSLVAGIYFGWRTYGLESDCNRVALAASFLRRFTGSSGYGKNIDITCLHRDIASPQNFAGILSFLFWDKIMCHPVAVGFFRNLHRSMSHDVLIVMSTKHLYDKRYPRMEALQQYFHVREGPTHRFSFKGSSETDRVQLFRLSRRIEVYTAPPPRDPFHTQNDSIYINVDERVNELKLLAENKWDELDRRKSKRSRTAQ